MTERIEVGDKVAVIQGTVYDGIWEMVADKVGTVVEGDPFPYDCNVHIPLSGRAGDTFAFRLDQLRKIDETKENKNFGPNAKMDWTDEEIQMQRVWRTLSVTNNSGFFVWDVMEVMGTPEPVYSYFTECRDGTYLLVQCYHYFTLEKAESFLTDTSTAWQTVIIVPATQSVCSNCGLKGNLPCGCTEN